MFLINNALKYYRNGTGLESSLLKFRIKSYFTNLLINLIASLVTASS